MQLQALHHTDTNQLIASLDIVKVETWLQGGGWWRIAFFGSWEARLEHSNRFCKFVISYFLFALSWIVLIGDNTNLLIITSKKVV